MGELENRFQDRVGEVESYFSLLIALDKAAQNGTPKLNATDEVIRPEQIKILHSSAYLQLYNLVESTMSDCIDSVAKAAKEDSRWKPGDLSKELRQEWVRFISRPHDNLNGDNRLAKAVELCDYLVDSLPVKNFMIEKGGGGNWDDKAIEEFIKKRLGFTTPINQAISGSVKIERFRDKTGALELIKKLRNKLAHGHISFVQCSESGTVLELSELKNLTKDYLNEVVKLFSEYISSFHFLDESHRPPSP